MISATEERQRAFLSALLQGNRQQGAKIALEMANSPEDIKNLYENVLKTSMYSIGQLWENGRISVASEHIASAIVEGVMNELYARMTMAQRRGQTAVAACVEEEKHQNGCKTEVTMDNKALLIERARSLPQVAPEAAAEYASKAHLLADAVSRALLQRPDVEPLVGAGNLAMMQDNHANHARFISAILLRPNADVLVETILWVFRAYRHHGFATTYWAAQLNTWFQILPLQLTPATWTAIRPYYEWLQVNIPLFVALTDHAPDAP